MDNGSLCILSDIAPNNLSKIASHFYLTFIVVLCAAWLAVAGTARADSCADFAAALPSTMASNIDNDRPTPEAQYDFAIASGDALEQESATFRRTCTASAHDTIFASSMLMAWLGWVEYFKTASPSRLTEGIQMLTACSVRYFGSSDGAICDEWARRAIGWRDSWQTAP